MCICKFNANRKGFHFKAAKGNKVSTVLSTVRHSGHLHERENRQVLGDRVA